jgi:hypothetical protein
LDFVFFTVAGAVGIFLLIVIANPRFFLPNAPRIKKVGPTYWGNYEGGNPEDNPDELKIEVKAVRRKEHVIAGSGMYARGRGVNMSGK